MSTHSPALNAINELTLLDFARNEQGQSVPIVLTRRTASPIKGVYTWKPSLLPDGPPARKPSQLPPPGQLKAQISAQELIGDGRCGTVYSTNILDIYDPQQQNLTIWNPKAPSLPNLVIKIADFDRLDDMEHEAGVYDEMESLQGIAIPRCYGWFEAELPNAWAVPEQDTAQYPKIPRKLSVLLLERMGGHLPLGERLPDRNDLWAVFNDMSRLGIEQPDMRYSNILYAPSSDKDSIGEVCPNHDCVHKYRVIDFDRARKTDYTLKQHYYEQIGTLGRLLEMMEMNIILEPWEY
ncbi:hypothetical protein CVT24_012529 [Panaeolus cyanescens]|uniref:Protein kinase domain-containing protein n=1 Tax=Panaeolus cyanescens TaxID=181874 RepID=A0A409YLD4_9AGAR|nr:hypothetical protein CVT24_012529 [Panaeolus cyanescens]